MIGFRASEACLSIGIFNCGNGPYKADDVGGFYRITPAVSNHQQVAICDPARPLREIYSICMGQGAPARPLRERISIRVGQRRMTAGSSMSQSSGQANPHGSSSAIPDVVEDAVPAKESTRPLRKSNSPNCTICWFPKSKHMDWGANLCGR